MKQLNTVAAMREALAEHLGSVGLVPTMGFLHAGHMALVERARKENGSVVVTIFVNPAQFGPQEDLSRYPRDMKRDLSMLANAGVDMVFAPAVEEMYPSGYASYVEVGGPADLWEGEHRPGHFRGVATVVAKLFNIIPADRAYFGQKDAQQVAVIKQMARDLNFRHKIVVVPTVREADGLALSSRNVYLSPEDRQAALVLSRSLHRARELFGQGERDAGRIRAAVKELLDAEPRVRPDYVAVADPESLKELETINSRALVALAARVGSTRLIDNVLLGE